MFLFLLIALLVVVGAITLVVVGGGDGISLPEAPPDQLADPLPDDRPLSRADVEALRLPMALRGYRMAEVDDVLGRLGAELSERDARIAELESALAGARATAGAGADLAKGPGGEIGAAGYDGAASGFAGGAEGFAPEPGAGPDEDPR